MSRVSKAFQKLVVVRFKKCQPVPQSFTIILPPSSNNMHSFEVVRGVSSNANESALTTLDPLIFSCSCHCFLRLHLVFRLRHLCLHTYAILYLHQPLFILLSTVPFFILHLFALALTFNLILSNIFNYFYSTFSFLLSPYFSPSFFPPPQFCSHFLLFCYHHQQC